MDYWSQRQEELFLLQHLPEYYLVGFGARKNAMTLNGKMLPMADYESLIESYRNYAETCATRRQWFYAADPVQLRSLANQLAENPPSLIRVEQTAYLEYEQIPLTSFEFSELNQADKNVKEFRKRNVYLKVSPDRD